MRRHDATGGTPSKFRAIQLVLANFDEVAPPDGSPKGSSSGPSRGLWQKATLISEQPGHLLVAPAVPSNASPPVNGAWHAAGRVFVPRVAHGRLCADLRADAATWSDLIRDLADRPVRIWTQVFSPEAAELIRALVDAGACVDAADLPRMSGQMVAFWNTKVGGRALLRDVPLVCDALPPAVICNTIHEVLSWVVGEPATGFVVKANASIGGAGIWCFEPGRARNREALEEQLTAVRDSPGGNHPKPKSIDDFSGPFLLEVLVGDPATNVSPTADFVIHDNDPAEFVGVSEQLLGDGISYRGACFPARVDVLTLSRCVDLGKRICFELHRRGYRGPVNVDFVVTDAGQVAVAEMNLRQSAPLDQFLVLRRLLGAAWAETTSYQCEEDVSLRAAGRSLDELAQELTARLPLAAGEFVQPLALYDHPDGSERMSLLAVANDQPSANQLVALARTVIGGNRGGDHDEG